MSRVPIRLRLTLAFALTMAVVLAAAGALIYTRVGDALEEQLSENLGLRAQALSALARERNGQLTAVQLGNDDENVAQLIVPGRLPSESLITTVEAERATAGAFFLNRDSLRALDGEPAKLLVTPVGDGLVLVVGASLEDREEAVTELLAQLLVAGPLALVLATLAGYVVSGAALRPVEAMRRRAEDVSSDRTGQQLPLPAARDEVRRLGETLNAMLGRLEAGIARERRFVADASHELRTPLALLRTELELALRRPRSPAELKQALESAGDQVDRLTTLAEALLVLARAEEAELSYRREAFPASELLETVVPRFLPRATAAGRALEIVGTSHLSLTGDRLRLEQALGNLVDNALRHGDGTVRIEAVRHDSAVELRVSDEGRGFPPAFLDRAFERFARADEARGGSSAGLGLSIVDAIARAHGGTASAVNVDGNGALVALTIPVESIESLTARHGLQA